MKWVFNSGDKRSRNRHRQTDRQLEKGLADGHSYIQKERREMELDKVLLTEIIAKNSPQLTQEVFHDSPSRRQEGNEPRNIPTKHHKPKTKKNMCKRKNAYTFRGPTTNYRKEETEEGEEERKG